MPKQPSGALSADKRPERGPRPGAPHVLAASLFLVAWLAFIAFLALYRAPLPSDAFAALAMQLASTAVPGAD